MSAALGSLAHGTRNLAVCVALGDVVALVVVVLALAQGQHQLYAPLLEVDLQRNEGKALEGDRLIEAADLLLVHQQPLYPHGVGVEHVALLVGAYVHAVDQHFAAHHLRIAVLEVAFAHADGLDLGSLELKPRFEALFDEVVVPSLAVLREHFNSLRHKCTPFTQGELYHSGRGL